MDADPIITSLRRRLRDDTGPGRAGSFWSDGDLLLALAAAQDILTQRLLTLGHLPALSRLRRTLALQTATPTPLPPDYLHAVSARVLEPGARPCRLLIGAPGMHYAARHAAYIAIVSGAAVTVHAGPAEVVAAELTWLARPAPILPAADPNFDPRIDFSPLMIRTIEECAVFLAALRAGDTRLAARAHGRMKEGVMRAALDGGLVEVRP